MYEDFVSVQAKTVYTDVCTQAHSLTIVFEFFAWNS